MKTACAVVNGDILVHAALYYTVKKEDGGYDFNSYFEYVKPWIEGADLAIGVNVNIKMYKSDKIKMYNYSKLI